MFDIVVTGIKEVLVGLGKVTREYRGNTRVGASHVMEDMAREMKTITPVDEGIMRGTIHVVGPEWIGNNLEGAWVAGGPAATYTVRQHEDLTLKHRVGQAKFITTVTDARMPEVYEAINNNIIKGK